MATIRIQIDLDERRVKELERLMTVCGLATKKELFNNALTLFEWAVDSVRQGRTIASLNETEQKFRELETPALRAAASHYRPERHVAAQF
jgi:hypothetical protein